MPPMPSFEQSLWTRPRLKRLINHAYVDLIQALHIVLGVCPWFVRNAVWRLLLKECGSGVFFDHQVYVKFPRLVCIGRDVSVNRGTEFYGGLRGRNRIRIGSNVRIAPNVRFHAAGHDPDHPDYADSGGDIVVEDDCWIGAGALVLQGVTIGHGSVVAAGSVVIHDIPPNSIAGGVPARVLRSREAGHARS
jgi:acetyltransferase-like isoleucine patch superfamily enzyme